MNYDFSATVKIQKKAIEIDNLRDEDDVLNDVKLVDELHDISHNGCLNKEKFEKRIVNIRFVITQKLVLL